MMRFLYWATNIETGEKVNFIDENLYDEGSEVTRPDGTVVHIDDLAVEGPQVSVDELVENWRTQI